ncbi:spermidine synthase [Paenibacillus oralis]|uniref:Spermidine synthase n=1 Tax=Paenibacillus oralis TaxID=2490856 RepID=A0A3P3TB12_9BACL|nr:fused MFS/spermidine synthase [Paenibacillus oralis]RRJ54724.1 spermidine synthase [Paenibacillus oralis]
MLFIYYILVFVTSFIYMGFEIAAVRVLTPYFGSTMFTWGAIISTFLTGSTIGYWIGGKNADKESSKLIIILYLVGGAATVGAVPVISTLLTNFIFLPERIGVLLGCVMLFLIPNVCLSALVPAISKEGLSLSFSGSQIGKFHTISALGSIAGTMVITFFVLPVMDLKHIFVIFTCGLIAALFLYTGKEYPQKVAFLMPCIALCFLPFAQYGSSLVQTQGSVLVGEKSSQYHNIYVVDHDKLAGINGKFRVMMFDPNGIQGAINLDNPKQVILPYNQNLIEVAEKTVPQLSNVFVIGHGVGTSTQYFEDHGTNVITAEIDPDVLSVSRKYFGYKGNSVRVGDGRKLLFEQDDNSISYLILDAYNNETIPFHLTTNEFFRIASQKLNENGVLAANVIGKMNRDEFLKAIHSTIQKNFAYVRVYASLHDENVLQNLTIVASNSLLEKVGYSNYFEVQVGSGEVITDSSTRFRRLN